jgi:hypothetical protein
MGSFWTCVRVGLEGLDGHAHVGHFGRGKALPAGVFAELLGRAGQLDGSVRALIGLVEVDEHERTEGRVLDEHFQVRGQRFAGHAHDAVLVAVDLHIDNDLLATTVDMTNPVAACDPELSVGARNGRQLGIVDPLQAAIFLLRVRQHGQGEADHRTVTTAEKRFVADLRGGITLRQSGCSLHG